MDLLFNILTDHVPKAVEVIRPHWVLIAVGIAAVVVLKLLLSALTSFPVGTSSSTSYTNILFLLLSRSCRWISLWTQDCRQGTIHCQSHNPTHFSTLILLPASSYSIN